MGVTKPYEFVGFGAVDVTKPLARRLPGLVRRLLGLCVRVGSPVMVSDRGFLV